jgi:nucleotidyltransferase substrate binding protein (TIGR01987 family)
MKDLKLEKALSNLKLALAERAREGASPINDAGVSKCFEVALEYFWKYLKRIIEDHGLEATSPKEAIKVAATMGFIKKPDLWIRFINNRNLAVHDYLGVDSEDYLKCINEFSMESESVLKQIENTK